MVQSFLSPACGVGGGHFIGRYKETFMSLLRVAAVCLAMVLVSSASAVTLLLEWDAANWAAAGPGEVDAQGVPITGYLDDTCNHPGIANGLITFRGGVRYVGVDDANNTSNAIRPYLDFYDRGWSTGTNTYTIFNRPEGYTLYRLVDEEPVVAATGAEKGVGTGSGYTMMMYLYAPKTMSVPGDNAGLGSQQSSKNQNTPLFSQSGTGSSLQSYTAIRRPFEHEDWAFRSEYVDSYITPRTDNRGEWFMFTKVFEYDMVTGEGWLYYYVNGELAAPPVSFDPGPDAFFSNGHGGGDPIGSFGGQANRSITGLGLGYFAVYDGAMSEAQVQASYKAFMTAGVPEPATMSLLALGGLALLRRRK